ncbi:MAG: hypothetical protein K9H61_05895 [Bacteroidia bacterium]|nr:hypothetical protein [Bacteroidia bacterium]MCF8425268.1 hypothetical protein [Bacteroidia bacterium]MCF8446510.1 hypothetical protein [Bacteroidia bacterium]
MKPLIFILFLLPQVILAQTELREKPFAYTKEIKWNPISLGLGSISFSYEKYTSPETSVNLWVNGFDFLYAGQIKGFVIGAGFRDYFSPEKPKSFYVEPFLKFQYTEEFGTHSRYNTSSVGLVLGRKWTFFERISTEVFIGPSYNFGLVKEGTKSSARVADWMGPINGIWGRFGINLGYRFN